MAEATVTESRGGGGSAVGILLGALISVLLLGFLAWQIEWVTFLEQFHRVQLIYVPVLVMLFLATFWIRAVRWRYLLPSELSVSTKNLFEATVVGFFASFILPLRAGEFIRPWMLSRTENVRFAVGFSSVVTERVFDVLIILGMLALAVPTGGEANRLIALGAQALGVLAGVILIVMLLAYLCSEKLIALTERILEFFLPKHETFRRKLLSLAEDIIKGFKAISSFKELFLVLGWSLLLWLITAVSYQVGLWMFGEFPGFEVGMAVTVIIALAVAAPSAPGFLGTFQFGCTAALTWIYGYSEELALAYSVVLHALQMVLVIGTGAWVLRSAGFNLAELKRSTEQ